MPFTYRQLEIPDLKIIEPKIFHDKRGYFFESYKDSDFKSFGISANFVQDNHSYSKKGVIRGLHYQLEPKSQGKLVRVLKGKVFDVAVDIRRNSKTFKKWIGIELDEEIHNMFWIPSGFAHGFLALTDEVHLVYKCTAEYSAELDRGIRYDDKEINIAWNCENPIVSEKDMKLPFLDSAEVF